jgi:hypothetical protein
MPRRLLLALPSVSLFFINVSVAAQSNPPVAKPLACSVVYVGHATNNPFTARRITKTTDTSATDAPKMPGISEIVARDSAGRVRIERHVGIAGLNESDPVVLHTRDGGEINTTHAELNELTMIFDCPDGKLITLQPGMKTARLYEGLARQPTSQAEHPYSFFFTSMLRHNPTADVFAEDLGHKTIEGVDALGVKKIQIGSEEDEWKGKPIRIFETWVSDDLAATLVETVIDLKKNTETTSMLIDVNRVEPDGSMFEIPAGYKTNPAPAEMPFQIGSGKSVAVQPKQ